MAEDEPADEAPGRPQRTSALWEDVRVDPVEIALPGGVGYTLRAYRPTSEIVSPDVDSDAVAELDDFDAAAAAVLRRRRASDDESSDDESSGGEFVDGDDGSDHSGRNRAGTHRAGRNRAGNSAADIDDLDQTDEPDSEELDEDDEEEEGEEDGKDEDIPVFLGRNGRVYLFHSQEKLVEFVRSGAEHDLSQLDTWSDLVSRVRTDDIAPLEEDSYELDLVVENLRGGPDAWEPSLILKAGELARDLGFALRMDALMIALAAGSPLDDLDEALRGAESGGVGSFFAKRRLKKIPAQQSSLAWRTLIGKISAVADWRD